MMSILNTKCLFDTNILVYALDVHSSRYKIAKDFIDNVINGKIEGVLAQQNIIELTNVLIKKLGVEKKSGLQIVHTYASKSNFNIITPQITTHNRFLNLCLELENRRKQFFDLYLAATMLDNEVNQIVTANDEDFTDIPGIKAINPWKK